MIDRWNFVSLISNWNHFIRNPISILRFQCCLFSNCSWYVQEEKGKPQTISDVILQRLRPLQKYWGMGEMATITLSNWQIVNKNPTRQPWSITSFAHSFLIYIFFPRKTTYFDTFITKIWKRDCALGSVFTQFWDFSNISYFLINLILRLFEVTRIQYCYTRYKKGC